MLRGDSDASQLRPSLSGVLGEELIEGAIASTVEQLSRDASWDGVNWRRDVRGPTRGASARSSSSGGGVGGCRASVRSGSRSVRSSAGSTARRI